MRRRPIPNRGSRNWGDDHRKILKKYYYPSCLSCGEGHENYDIVTGHVNDPESAWKGLHSHHRNGDPNDNWPGNLCVLCESCHSSIHNSSDPADTQLWDELPWDKKAQAIETKELAVPRQERRIFDKLQQRIRDNRRRYRDEPLEDYDHSIMFHDMGMSILDLHRRVNQLQRRNGDEQLRITEICKGVGGLPAHAFTTPWKEFGFKEVVHHISSEVQLTMTTDDTELKIAK